MNGIGLVLQGGGMRGIYTSGVLDFFMEKGIYFPYTIGVSAGACNGSMYISRQMGLAKRMYLDYIDDPRYINYANILKRKSVLGMDFIFGEIPKSLNPFDLETFKNSKDKFLIVTTDCDTGKPVYFDKDDCQDIFTIIKASSSIPFITDPVDFLDMKLIDGGISDPIPIKKSIQDGNDLNVVVLTDSRYMRKPNNIKRAVYKMCERQIKITDHILNMHRINNETIDYINDLEKEKKAVVIKPSKNIKMGIVNKNKSKLKELYELGYEDAKNSYLKIKKIYS
ncbi:Predicted phospholipase, patatin/cPLA2 family [Alkalithermobacter thermoalcaliphilus JW-YL-7 = DSM 7308]|uniref:Patatin n=1 Tax=Alkalithermobacter thermoalcaliphilus JW-YL-7 = DSM 7308 TaxID=1121328 RepID=A0A150FRK6_CLOPD|nr:Patatin [[Clostridium] paradoxum JW-YL-7 = DSM 7308]SHK41946.1 Predicted phospholipase, patatin/cPLA2 family [[Clostridium] paradoxum JW-YL-7 = DSM 7308]